MNEHSGISSHYLGRHGKQYASGRFDDRMEFGRLFQSRYFRPSCTDDRDLLDFGCAMGLFLRSLPARKRIGVEVNPVCVEECKRQSEASGTPIELHESLHSVADECVDIVISNHVLEHVLNPLEELRHMHRVLRPSGRLVLVTPFDDFRSSGNRKYDPGNPDHHLFTWSPMNLGNLVGEAGFQVRESKLCTSAWSPRIFWVERWFGMLAFRWACVAFSIIKQRREVFCLAVKS